MSKISFVSGSLHSISGQISEAASRMHNPQDAAENDPEETVRTEPESVSAPPAPVADSAVRNAYLKPRYEELLRMKRDLSAQLHEAEARFSAEQARFEAVAAERRLPSSARSCRVWKVAGFRISRILISNPRSTKLSGPLKTAGSN